MSTRVAGHLAARDSDAASVAACVLSRLILRYLAALDDHFPSCLRCHLTRRLDVHVLPLDGNITILIRRDRGTPRLDRNLFACSNGDVFASLDLEILTGC